MSDSFQTSDKNGSSKKKRRVFRPFVKEERMLNRLKHYIGDEAFKANEQQICQNLQGSTKTKKQRRVVKYQNNQDFSYVIDKKGDSLKNVQTYSDSEASLDNTSYKETSNVLNDSLRTVYSNSSKEEPKPLKTVDINNDSNNMSPSPSVIKMNNSKKNLKISEVNDLLQSGKKAKNTRKPIEVPLEQSLIKFSDIGGLEDTLREICMLLQHLKHPGIYKKIGVKNPPRGFLLHGPPGCGKTLIAHAIAGELELPFIKVAATELVSGVSGESESKIRDLFEQAVSCAPCIVFIDEIDAITPKREIAQREMEKRIVTQLLKCMDELNMKDSETQVMVIGATNRPHSLDPALRRAGRFDREISIGIPNETARFHILKVICNELKLLPEFDLHWLARNTPGYVGADLMAITREAANNAVTRVFQSFISDGEDKESCKIPLSLAISWLKDKPPLTEEQLENFYVETQDFESALQVYIPSAKREGFATIPNVTWKDVGALKSVQEVLQTAILWPIKYQKEFKDFHLTSPTGILLCGPKGCGKTLLAKAVANECSINFLSIKGPELLSMYVGESERAVRECFQRAKNSAPCVIFFDEIDALCPARSSSNENAAAERVVNQLLTEIDGIEGRKHIFVMGATNRPENIDSAMLRPGRFEKIIFVGVPNQEDRLDILQTITKNGTQPKIGCDINLQLLANDVRCQGFSGADLSCLVREASFKAFKDYISSKHSIPENFEIKLCHFEYAFTIVKPSITDKDQYFFRKEMLLSNITDCS